MLITKNPPTQGQRLMLEESKRKVLFSRFLDGIAIERHIFMWVLGENGQI